MQEEPKKERPKVVPIREIHGTPESMAVNLDIKTFLNAVRNSEEMQKVQKMKDNIHFAIKTIFDLTKDPNYSEYRYSEFCSRKEVTGTTPFLIPPENQKNLFEIIRIHEIELEEKLKGLNNFFYQIINKHLLKDVVEKSLKYKKQRISLEGSFADLERFRMLLVSFNQLFIKDPLNRNSENTNKYLVNIQEILEILDINIIK